MSPLIKGAMFCDEGEKPPIVAVPEGVHIDGPEEPQYCAEANCNNRAAMEVKNNFFIVLGFGSGVKVEKHDNLCVTELSYFKTVEK